MYQVLIVIHVLVAFAIIGLVMLQQGRGADAGAGFGGASSSVFGARGAASFLSRTTAIFATVFFVTSLSLAYLAGNKDNKVRDIMDDSMVSEPAKSDLPPVAPAGNPPRNDVPVAPAPANPAGKN